MIVVKTVNQNLARWKYLPPGIVFLLLALCWKVSICQSGYNDTYNLGRSIWLKNIVYSQDIGIVISGVYYNDSSNWQNAILVVIDTSGQLLGYTEVSDPMGLSHLTVNDESGMILSKNTKKAVLPFSYFNRPSFGMALIDSLGGIDFIHEYPQDSGSVTSPRDIVEVSDGYLITGWTSKPPLYMLDAFVLKTNSYGQPLWLRYYGHPLYEETARSITRVSENEYVISGTKYQWQHEPNFYHGWAYAIDNMGNKKWEWEASEDEIPHRSVMSMQYDTLHHEWVYVSLLEKPVFVKDLGRDVDLSVPVLVRRDNNMQLLSYQEYGPYAYNGYMGALEKTRDGGWIAVGNITCLTEESPYNECNIESGRVLNLTNDGTLEWSVIDTAFYHPELGSRSYLSGVTETPSGSVYAVGWANNYDDKGVYRSFGWLLKITADGCVDTLCTTTSLLEQIEDRETKVKIYPNPARDYIIVDIIDDTIGSAYIELFDPVGHLLLRQPSRNGVNVILLDDVVSGLYVWHILETDGKVVGMGKVIVQ